MMYYFLRYPIILGFNEPDRGNRAFGADLRFKFGVQGFFFFFTSLLSQQNTHMQFILQSSFNLKLVSVCLFPLTTNHARLTYICMNTSIQFISIYTQIGQVVAALFATELFHVHFRAKSSGIQGRVKFGISTHFSVPKWKK